MGLIAQDITPIASVGPTTNIPAAKDVFTKVFAVARTDTASTLKCVLPGDASILSIQACGSSVSNAGTSASVTLTVANNSGTVSTGAYDVKTNGATNGIVNMTNLPNITPIPLVGDIRISAIYAETGTTSSSGGPWNFIVNYVR